MTADNLPAVFEQGQLASSIKALVESGGLNNSDLSEGIGSGFGVISIKASKFRIKYKGEEFPIVDANGDPVPSLECVIVKANPNITKQFYAEGFVDGSTSPPDCYSLDGKKPDERVENPVHVNCATCPKNQFGSRITEAGKKAKACNDTRRLVVVPLNDMKNESFGGPLLFRVPPSALKGLQEYADMLSRRQYPYFAVATRIGFDIDASHPLPIFKPIRPLSEEEAATVLELRDADLTSRILADHVADVAAPAAAPEVPFEQPPPAAKPVAAPRPAAAVVRPAPAPAAKPVAAPAPKPAAVAAPKPAAPKPAVAKPAAAKPAPAPAPAPAPVPAVAEPESTGDLDADIQSILAGLDATADGQAAA